MKTISRSQYQQLAALLSISGSNVQALCDLEEAVLLLLEIEPDVNEPNDYVQEAVFGDEHDADELLARLGIAVEPSAADINRGGAESAERKGAAI